MKNIKKISLISAFHFYKLIFRSVLLIAVLVFYIIGRVNNTGDVIGGLEDMHILLGFVWLVFFVEMIFRFFPSPFESVGCQKQFSRNYIPTGEKMVKNSTWRSTLAVFISWIILNAIIGALYFFGIFDKGILILISLFYSVCDMICILFFCPFQTWFMKNKCCGSCRIYNWDYAMMFTPLVFIPNVFTWSIFGVSLILVLVWEILLRKYPERFTERTNSCLSCGACKEKLCQHKKQLRSFLKKNRELLISKGCLIIEKTKKKFTHKPSVDEAENPNTDNEEK